MVSRQRIKKGVYGEHPEIIMGLNIFSSSDDHIFQILYSLCFTSYFLRR